MSDDEIEYEYDYGSDRDYNYGSDDGNMEDVNGGNNQQIEIENAFYEGDDLRSENPIRAIEMFDKVVQLEKEFSDQVKWRFKALQHLVIIHNSLGIYDEMIARYREMLQYLTSVTRNECNEAINAILDALVGATNNKMLSEMYEITLLALKTSNNERLWFNTNLKLARLYLEDSRFDELERIVAVLKSSCQNADGSDDMTKSSSLQEVYCLELQLCSRTQNLVKLRIIHKQLSQLDTAVVADPRTTAIIKEEGGKLYMAECRWDEAYNEFYEAFRSYQEAGNSRARDCLKYVVLASMLALTDINPFAAREAKVYADDKEIIAMSDLRSSLEANDLARFERTVRNVSNKILDEPFLMTYIEPLRRRMQEQALLNIMIPYSKVKLSSMATALSLSELEVESLIVEMILDNRIQGHINQIQGYFVFQCEPTQGSKSFIIGNLNAKIEDLIKEIEKTPVGFTL